MSAGALTLVHLDLGTPRGHDLRRNQIDVQVFFKKMCLIRRTTAVISGKCVFFNASANWQKVTAQGAAQIVA